MQSKQDRLAIEGRAYIVRGWERTTLRNVPVRKLYELCNKSESSAGRITKKAAGAIV